MAKGGAYQNALNYLVYRDTFLGCAKVLLSVHRGLILTSSGPENGVPQLQHNQYVSIGKSSSHRKRGHCGIA